MKTTRLIGIVLIIAFGALAVWTMRRQSALADKWAAATGNLLAVDLRRHLRSPADSVLARLEVLRQNPPLGDGLFNFIKQETDEGHISGGFVEVPALALMDPADTNFAAAEAYGPLAVSYPPGLKIPPGEGLEDFLKTMERAQEQGRGLTGAFYVYWEGPPAADWIIQPYSSPHDGKVYLIGLAFGLQETLPPNVAQILSERFSKGPTWQWAVAPGEDFFALELLTPARAIAYSIGDVSGKSLTRQFTLDKSDLGYDGWKINVRAKGNLGADYFVLSGIMAIAGVVLVML